MNNVDFLQDADNVYRTKHFIVKQVIDVEVSDIYDNIILSHDTFYLRTPIRDKQYEKAFAGKSNIEGKRLPSTTTTRRYVF